MTTTTYDIMMRYVVRDNASGKIRRISRSTDGLTRMFRRAAVAAGAYFGGRQVYGSLIKFNAGIEGAKIQMAGLLQLNTGGTFNRNLERSTDLVAALQKRAKASVGTTKDFVDMASMITRPVTRAGLGMAELEDMTSGAVVAAQAFGIQADMAARDIESALMGNLNKRDRFARALLEHAGYSTESFNKLDARKRAQALSKALKGPAITAMAKAQEQSFSGRLSTLQDNFEIFMGKVGTPLFEAITKELGEWNKWIDKNEAKMNEIARTVGKKLVNAFGAIKDAVRFMVEHADTIKALGMAFAGFKGAQFAASSMSSFADAVKGSTKSLLGLVPAVSGLTMFLVSKYGAQEKKRERLQFNRGAQVSLFREHRSLGNKMSGAYGDGTLPSEAEQRQMAKRIVQHNKALGLTEVGGFVDRKKLAKRFNAPNMGLDDARKFSQLALDAGRTEVWKNTEAYIDVLRGTLEAEKILAAEMNATRNELVGGTLVSMAKMLGNEMEKQRAELSGGALVNLLREQTKGIAGLSAFLPKAEEKVDPMNKKPTVVVKKIEVRANNADEVILGMAKYLDKSIHSPNQTSFTGF